jgi:hypothetical protein
VAEITLDKYLSESGIPEKYWPTLKERDGYVKMLQRLRRDVSLRDISITGGGQRAWELVGLFYQHTERPHQALIVFRALYERMLQAQLKLKKWCFKSMPLVWLADTYRGLGFHAHARRYAMLTLCEHAIPDKGDVNVEGGGIYFRLAWQYGMPDHEIRKYAKESFGIYQRLGKRAWFPERILLGLDKLWIVDFPSRQELLHYVINPHFVGDLISHLGRSRGKELEVLAQYILACMPGTRTYTRKKSYSTDYDVVCSFEGLVGDFRDEIGRYVICECKRN